MAVPRYEDRVHSGVGQSSAFICSSLALFGLEHQAEFTRLCRFARIGFARSFRSDDLVSYDEPGSGVAVWSLLHFGDGREVDATSRHPTRAHLHQLARNGDQDGDEHPWRDHLFH
jgi:hypothetical protein